jgi:arsenate reductase
MGKNGWEQYFLPHPDTLVPDYLAFMGNILMNKKKVIFLCTGNSCRSQIAEGLVNHYLGDEWQAYSAGTEPAGYVHPMAVEVMSELEINIMKNRSKSVAEFRDTYFDLVVTVCDDAAENCPVWFGPEKVVHISFPDPAKAEGSMTERLAVFRQVRDDMGVRVLNYLTERV